MNNNSDVYSVGGCSHGDSVDNNNNDNNNNNNSIQFNSILYDDNNNNNAIQIYLLANLTA
jgi:hypothetical protein